MQDMPMSFRKYAQDLLLKDLEIENHTSLPSCLQRHTFTRVLPFSFGPVISKIPEGAALETGVRLPDCNAAKFLACWAKDLKASSSVGYQRDSQ